MGFKRRHISMSAQFKLVLALALLLAGIELANLLLGRALNLYGLVPRQPEGLLGVLTAPLLHGSVMHFSSNIVPLCVFAWLLLQHGVLRFALVTAVVVLVSGALVWAFARSAIHVGASGLIYGYFAYLLLAGLLSREFKLGLISLFVGLAYGGMIWGVLPSMPYVSWEFHLFGFIAGILAALRWGRVQTKK